STYYNGYGFVSVQGKLMSDTSYGNYGKAYGKSIKSGDLIDMYVSFTNNKMWFKINGEDFGVAYNNIKEGAYRMACTLNWHGEVMRFVSYEVLEDEEENEDDGWNSYLCGSSMTINGDEITNSGYNSCFGRKLIDSNDKGF